MFRSCDILIHVCFYERRCGYGRTEGRKARPRAYLYWLVGPCGRGENHFVGRNAVSERSAEKAGAGGSQGRVFGHRGTGTAAGDYYFFQAGCFSDGKQTGNLAGYPWPCGFFQRDGAGTQCAGSCCAGDQRHRWGAEPYPYAVASFEPISHPHIPLYQ